MQNYKVEVKNHSEGMEAQDLFLKMGFRKGVCIDSRYPKLIVTDNYDDDDWYSSGAMIYYSKECKQITLQELRAMVAPKQKEYLVKTDTGYTLQVLSDVVDGHDGIIEVPEGAVALVTYDKNAGYWFNKENKFKGFGRVSCIGDFGKIDTLDNDSYLDYSNAIDGCVAWERKESLNDQVASAEQARQEQTKCKCSTKELHESDLVNDGQSIMDSLVNGFSEGGFIPKQNHGVPAGVVSHGFSGFTQPEELPFVDDKLKGVDATLAEREAQYGSFIGVANTTGQLMSVLLNSKNGQTLPYAHQEALHMICSKMARIVNGDHNHLDSWHDIGGYAKLIENNIK